MWCVGAGTRERAHFLLRLFCPKEIFFYIYVLSQCMIYRINFQNYIPLHVKKHYYIYFCLFLKSSMKAFSTSLSNNLQKVMFPVASQLDLQLCATPVCFLFFFECHNFICIPEKLVTLSVEGVLYKTCSWCSMRRCEHNEMC